MLLTLIRILIYGVAALACWHSAIQSMQHFNRLGRRAGFVWWTLGAIIFFIMITRVLNLDITITDSLREVSQEQHWYSRRHGSQVIMLALGLLIITVLVTGVQTILRSYSKILMAPVIGTAVLSAMELARFVSIHETDKLFGITVGLPVNWGVQLLAIAAILYGAWLSFQGEPAAPMKKIRARPVNNIVDEPANENVSERVNEPEPINEVVTPDPSPDKES